MRQSIPLNRFDLTQTTEYNRMPEPFPIRDATRRHNRYWTAPIVTSYIFDWVVLAAAAAVGAVLAFIEPNKRPFSVVDPSISYVSPHGEQKGKRLPLAKPYLPPSSQLPHVHDSPNLVSAAFQIADAAASRWRIDSPSPNQKPFPYGCCLFSSSSFQRP